MKSPFLSISITGTNSHFRKTKYCLTYESLPIFHDPKAPFPFPFVNTERGQIVSNIQIHNISNYEWNTVQDFEG